MRSGPCAPAPPEHQREHRVRAHDGYATAGARCRPGMRESTVKAPVSRILTTLAVTNPVQAVLLARDAGLQV